MPKKLSEPELQEYSRLMKFLKNAPIRFDKVEKDLNLSQGIIWKSVNGQCTCYKHTQKIIAYIKANLSWTN